MGWLPKSWNSWDDIFGSDPAPAPTVVTPITNTPENNQPFSPTNVNNIDTTALGQGLSDIAQANLILGSYGIAMEQAKSDAYMKSSALAEENANQRVKYIGQIAMVLGLGFLFFRGKK